MNDPTFQIEPYAGAKPLMFGMKPDEVKKSLDALPVRAENYDDAEILKNEYYFESVRVHYDRDETVDEISFVPKNGVRLFFGGANLFDERAIKNPLTAFLREDENPLDDYGFIVFEKLGIAVTGYHDRDRSQRAVTVFKKGRWTDLDKAKPVDLSRFAGK